MKDIFKLLPSECTPNLNKKEREILLKQFEYEIPGGDSLETELYTMTFTTESNDFLRYESSFTTGQRGFSSYELRRFKKSDGKDILIFSRCGGAPENFSQHELRFFQIENNRLTSIEEKLLPLEIPITEFLKKDTPDSTSLEIKNSTSGCYELLFSESDNIEYRITPGGDIDDQWVLGYAFEFAWNGKEFIKQEIKE